MNKSCQEISSEHEAIINRLYKFYNRNASSVRTIMISKCLTPEEPIKTEDASQDELDVSYSQEVSGSKNIIITVILFLFINI